MPRSILLTGATGFLGMQVLDRILEETDRPVLACVRATDAVSAQRRIAGTLETLYGSNARHPGRVRAIPADLALPAFGLAPPTWPRLAREGWGGRVQRGPPAAAGVLGGVPRGRAGTAGGDRRHRAGRLRCRRDRSAAAAPRGRRRHAAPRRRPPCDDHRRPRRHGRRA